MRQASSIGGQYFVKFSLAHSCVYRLDGVGANEWLLQSDDLEEQLGDIR